MSTSKQLGISGEQEEDADKRRLEYSKYADQFDHQNQHNPAYHELQDLLAKWIPYFSLGTSPAVCDLGAGTGSFILRLHEEIPGASFVHLDKDKNMNNRAREKYKQASISDIRLVEELIQNGSFSSEQFDLIVCVNALNTAPPQQISLSMMHRWLKPGGWLFVVDFGRKQNVFDWAVYCAYHAAKKDGFTSMLKYAAGCTQAFKQNLFAKKDQANGAMWLHGMDEFREMVASAGFDIEHSSQCYRGYADLVVAQKDPIVVPEPNPL
ncbi:MAG: class I SAM-dependent methyltransferase [Pseudomonadales bacterium]|nr:class I SAM-dependent methyltransferase [Pseudomonadales bacterium]